MVTIPPGGPRERIALARMAAPAWGVAGIVLVLVYAIARLSRFVVDALDTDLTGLQWIVLVANVACVGYAEGIRGFERRFSPRVAARALDLYRQPTPLRSILAPLFCAGFFAATPRLLRITWIGAGLIVVVVLLVGLLPQPWRGIVDAGVLAGLGWGSVSLVRQTVLTFRAGRPLIPAEVPGRPGL